MWNKNRIILGLCFMLVFGFGDYAFAEIGVKSKASVTNSAGAKVDSAGYKSVSSMGEAVTFVFGSGSANYKIKSGFLYAVDEIDVTPPSGTIQINSGSAYTKLTSVTLNLSAQDNPAGSGLDKMQFSNDSIAWTTAEAYSATKTWILSSSDGLKAVYARFQDKAGNWSAIVLAKITLDTQPPLIISSWPANGSFIPTEGAALITLNIVYGDALSGINLSMVQLRDGNGSDITAQAQISENNIQYEITSPQNKQYKFTLSLEDKAGNKLSQEFKFSVDATLPVVSVDIIGGTFTQAFNVKISCSEDATIYYSTDGYPPIEGSANTIAV